MDINIRTGLQVLAGSKTKSLQKDCEDFLSQLQEWYGISDCDMEFFAAFLKDYTESFAGDAYDMGMQAGVETGTDAGYHNAVADAEEALTSDVVKSLAKMRLDINLDAKLK